MTDREFHDINEALLQNDQEFQHDFDIEDVEAKGVMYEAVPTYDNVTGTTDPHSYDETTEDHSSPDIVESNGEALLIDEDHRPFPLFSTDERDNLHVNNFYITMPWSPQVYFTVRGAENFHIYLWIAKDLSWTRDAYVPALTFGTASILWCVVLMYHAVSARCITEVYMLIVMILWIAGNFLWMSGNKLLKYIRLQINMMFVIIIW